MIITTKRDFKELMENIKNYKSFFLIGCSECATLCGTGGEPELKEMKEVLEKEGKTVTGTFVAKTGCQVLGTKVELKPFKDALDKSDCILVMSCGGTNEGKCEVSPDIECAWVRIYNRMKRLDKLEDMKKVVEPKDWSAHR